MFGAGGAAHAAYTDQTVNDANWSTIWSDEFNTGTAPNSSNWFTSWYWEGFGTATYKTGQSSIVNDGTFAACPARHVRCLLAERQRE